MQPHTRREYLAAEILKRDPELQPHLDALGLESVEEYTAWCARHGFSVRLDKHWHQRCKERYFAAQTVVKHRLARKKHETRQARRTIQSIFDGYLNEAGMTQPYLVLVCQMAATIDEQRTRDAFRQLLLHAEGQTGLLTTQPALSQFGTQSGNTFIEGLLALARNQEHWIRPLNSWTPRSHNVRRQFSSLAGHVLAQFAVPAFMDSVWFHGQSDDALRQQAWYKSLAAGQSPRDLDLPIPLTRRMAHHFLKAPRECSVDTALRFAQVRGLGGNGRLIQAIIGSRIGTTFDNNDFWITVIRWFIKNPMFDPAQVGPLIDYIHRQKFERSEMVGNAGQTEYRALNPDFSMKGRTAATLLRQMQEWHVQLRKEPERPQLQWPTSGFGSFDWTEGAWASNSHRRWTIIELLSRKELYDEGRVMRHCVASYDNSCKFGGTSIWSLGVQRNLGRRKRVLTIEVANRMKSICQIRGKANRFPGQKELEVVRRWASLESLRLASGLGNP